MSQSDERASGDVRAGQAGPRPSSRRPVRHLVRFAIYALVAGALLVFRVVPGIHTRFPGFGRKAPSTPALTISGLDVAPDLIQRAIDEYKSLYPSLEIRALTGGTLHAVDDLLAGRADIAFMNRPLTAGENALVRHGGDSVLAFPIALGGVTVAASGQVGLDSLPLERLKELVEEAVGEEGEDGERIATKRIYAPDPNLGLWGAVAAALGLPEAPRKGVVWLESEAAVLEAVSRDTASLGLVSTLAVPRDHEGAGWRTVRLYREAGARAASPSKDEIAVGEYPLPHYLYVSQLASGNEFAAGFVTFLYSGRGQRWVRHEGYLPAREALREVILTNEPIGEKS